MSVPPIQDVLDLLQQGDVQAAIDMLEQTVEEVPAHLTAHVILARAYEARQQWNRALRSWEHAHFFMPTSPIAQEGKQRVLRRIEGEDPPAEPDAPPSSSSDVPSSTTDKDAAEESILEDDSDLLEPEDPEAPSDLEELRRQTEEKAQQGGARPGLDNPFSAADLSTTPEEHIEQLEDAEPDSELDSLIEELESARIEPKPDMEDVPAPDLDDDVDDLVSETLARIHAAQDQYREAARIYRQLATQEPDRSQEYLEKAAEMRERAEAGDEEE